MAGKKTFDFTGMLNSNTTQEPGTPQEPKTTGSRYVSKKTGAAYTKHNFAFSDETFAKLKLLQRQTGMAQHALLDVIISRYIEEYEKKFGALTDAKPQLL